jgi:hypothetical protein
MTMPKIKIPVLGAALVGALALAACGGTTPGAEPAAEPPSEPPAATTEEIPGFAYPTDPSAVVLDLTACCGFVPVEVAVDTRPSFRLYGDGTVLVKPEEFELAFPTLRTYQLTPDGIQAVLEEAEAAGLLAPAPDYGMPPVTDMPTTTLEIALDGESYTHDAYGLDFDDTSGLTPEQAEARARYASFASFLATLDSTHPELLATEPVPYEPEAVRVYAWERELEPGQTAPPWPLEPGIETWPVEPAFGASCLVISGPDLDALLASVAEQEWPFTWESGGKAWTTGMALQLPGDAGCAG